MSAMDDPHTAAHSAEEECGVSDMTVKTVRSASAPSDAPRAVVVTDGDDHAYTICFEEQSDGVIELVTGDVLEEPTDPHRLQMAVMTAASHLRKMDGGNEVVLESLPDEPEEGYPCHDEAYFYGGGDATHLFKGRDATAMCEGATVSDGRERLDALDHPISELDGLCPKCARQLKLAGHYEAYERPSLF